jgi:hypothetical protein
MGMEICFKIGIEKGNNGYPDKNKIKVVLTPDSQEFISGGVAPQVAHAPAPAPQAAAPAPAQAQGVTPPWAR